MSDKDIYEIILELRNDNHEITDIKKLENIEDIEKEVEHIENYSVKVKQKVKGENKRK